MQYSNNVNNYDSLILGAANQYNLDPQLLKSVLAVESNGNPAAVSKAGAMGVMQFIPSTARQYDVNPFDPSSAIPGAANYLSKLIDQYHGNVDQALSAYNGSLGDKNQTYARSVADAYRQIKPAAGQPPTMAAETRSPQSAPQSISPSDPALPVGLQQAIEGTPATSAAAGQPTPTTAPAVPDDKDLPAGLAQAINPPQPQAAKPPAPLPPAAPAPPPPPGVDPFNAALVGSDDAVAQTISPTGPLVPIPQTEAGAPGILPGLSHGLREAVNPLLEAGSRAGNWLADKTGWDALRTDRVANDIASEQAFQQQYGGTDPTSQAAQGVAGVTRVVAPLAMGGATAKAIEGAAALADAPEAGAFLTGQGFQSARGFPGFVGRLASGATSGAIQGGVAGGPGGAAVGAAFGGTAAPAIGSVADWAVRRFGAGVTPAIQKIYQATARDGTTPQQLDAAVGQLGPLGTVADVGGANLRQLAEGVANAPGPGQQVAVDYLTRRAEGQTQRLNAAVKDATGATGSAFDTMEQLSDARSAAAAPAYANAFQNTVVTPAAAQQLGRFVTTPVGQRALQNGIANAQLEAIANGTPFSLANYGVTQGADGSYALTPGVPNLRAYDAIKRGYDSLVENFRDPTSGRLNLSGTVAVPGMGGQVSGKVLNDVRQSYTGQLRQLFPDYAQALDAWAGPSADMDALTMGRRVLTADPDATAANVAKLTPSQKQMYQVGVAQALNDRVAATPDDADATRRIFGNDLIRSRIAAGFGGENDPAFQNFQNTMQQEATFAQTERTMLRGSPTARRTAAIQAAAQPGPPMHLVEPVAHLVMGGGIPAAGASLVRQAVNPLLNWAGQPSERYNLALGNFLFNPQGRDALVNQLLAGPPPTVRNMLTGWPGQQAVQAVRNAGTPSGAGARP